MLILNKLVIIDEQNPNFDGICKMLDFPDPVTIMMATTVKKTSKSPVQVL